MEITTHGDPLKNGCVTLRCPSQCRWRLSYWQVVSSAPESNFTGRFDAVVSGAMIIRHTDPKLGPIQLYAPPAPRGAPPVRFILTAPFIATPTFFCGIRVVALFAPDSQAMDFQRQIVTLKFIL